MSEENFNNSEVFYNSDQYGYSENSLYSPILIEESYEDTLQISIPLDSRSKFILLLIQAFVFNSNITPNKDYENTLKNEYLDFENITRNTTIQRGRNKSVLAKLLSNFLTWQKDNTISNKQKRKEYFNSKIIRNFHKLIRHALEGKVPRGNSIEFDYHNPIERDIWNNLQTICIDNKEFFERISDSKKFPSKSEKNKCFNNAYYEEIFKHACVKKAFEKLIKLFFFDYQIEKLKKRFGIVCCLNQTHCFLCYSKWGHLNEYIMNFPNSFNGNSEEINLI
ncbi:hypothetical protein SteCoe_14878 [Stentor coeruleus]|uniref:Uncharacterized protein n=1 Tax=Stentor coeruleus TaxID=5963 RepID=A0A1R2C4Z8_9CILI|nr:hypothetical protein SteCoe_14878 [Stentor coeruleus]